MTKKKKTLRAAVLASIFAMAFSATAWGASSTYNPNLQDDAGTGAGTVGSNVRYPHQHNYFMQYNEYFTDNPKEGEEDNPNIPNGTGNPERWDRIIGIFLKDDFKKKSESQNIDTITIQGAQLYHVNYTVEEDGSIKIGNPDSRLPEGTEYERIAGGHYCGESAQSVSIGQLQRMNEVYYENDVALQTAIVSEADKRACEDSILNIRINNEANTRANADTALDGRLDAIEAGYVKSVVNNDDNTWTVKHNNCSEVEIKNTTYNVVEAKGSGSTINTYTIKGNNGDDAGEIVDTNKYVTEIKHSNINADGNDKGKLTTTLTFNDNTSLTTCVDIGKYVKDNAGDSWFDVDKKITLKQAITAAKTTVEEGKNIDVTKIDNADGSFKYTVSTKDDVNFNEVTTKTLNVTDTANIKIANIKTTNTEVINLGTKEGGTYIRYDVDDDRITYNGMEKIANLNDGKTFAGDSGSAFVKLQDDVNIIGGANVQNLSDKNIGVVAEANKDGSATLNVKLSRDITGLNSVTSTTVNSETINVSKVVNINNQTQITENGMNINNKVIVEENKVDVGGNKIENVAPGELSPDSQDAVNGSQLFNTNQKLDRLGNRVDKVGAGAAALAALHPLDFDPDDKLSFSAGVGNYGGETASALGMFYRPTEKVMLSAAGTMGNGENMVNMGVTFALDRKNNVSNSRVAMAREIQDLREQVAALTALVTQLAGRNNPVLMDTVMFPDVPENHWAYDYIEGLQRRGIVEGYPDGNFGGDRSMTRYEYAAMLYRALEKGFPVDSRLLDEFDAELGRIRIDRIKGLDDDDNKIERVRVNQYEDRDDYGSKLTAVNEAE